MSHLSVCVLSYERRNLLVASIESMVETADEPLEIIVHDDGSSVREDFGSAEDDVRLWLFDAVEEGKISRLILNPPGHNEGQGVALNRMFHMASGDIIVKADQDLIYRPGWTKAIRTAFEVNDKQFDAPIIGALGLFKYHVEPVRWEDHLIRECGAYDEVRDFVGSLMAIPREAWKQFGPFEERSSAFAEDAVFKQRITAEDFWCCALTPEDYVENVGFGVGPDRSTLVKGFDDQGKGILAEIKDGPRLVEKEGVGA